MSTPLGHNTILATSVIEALRDYNSFWNLPEEKISEAFYKIMSVTAGYYNYPDATQAIRRTDGSILTRRVTHFETAKDGLSNYHTPFTASFLRNVTESDIVEDFFDANDQQGNVMGRMSDFIAIDEAFSKYLSHIDSNYLMAKFAVIHLKGVDRLNDLLFRQYITENDDGSLTIGSVTYTSEEKKEVFGPLKSLIMDSQEQLAQSYFNLSFPDCDYERLNKAITCSYELAYSPWLAGNTLKFVKPLSNVTLYKPINDLYSAIGLDEEDFTAVIFDFVCESVTVTKLMIEDFFYPDFEKTMSIFEAQ